MNHPDPFRRPCRLNRSAFASRWFGSGLLCIAVWLSIPGVASAGHFYTGEEILRHCENRSNLFDQGRCLGFLSGVVDYIEFARKAYPNKRGHAFYFTFAEICIPAGVTQGELQKVWVRFANREQVDLERAGVMEVARAFALKWPCEGAGR